VPHGGFGMGIERCVAWICGLEHIRETIAFPRMLYRIARIGAEGQLASLHLDGGDATLKWDVTAALEVSCFKPRCTGRKAAFEFAFTLLEDNPTDYIAAPLVRFVPPNPLRTDFPAREREY
jgi:hypothetical protein